MVRKLISLTAAGAMAIAAMALPTAPVSAQGYYNGGYGDGYYQVRNDRGRDGRGGRGYRNDRGYGDDRGYHGGRGYRGGRGGGYYAGNDYGRGDYGRGYRGGNGRGYGRCRDNGTGGTVIGAIAGGLIGNGVAGYGDRTLGSVLGAGAGALAGRAIDRDC